MFFTNETDMPLFVLGLIWFLIFHSFIYKYLSFVCLVEHLLEWFGAQLVLSNSVFGPCVLFRNFTWKWAFFRSIIIAYFYPNMFEMIKWMPSYWWWWLVYLSMADCWLFLLLPDSCWHGNTIQMGMGLGPLEDKVENNKWCLFPFRWLDSIWNRYFLGKILPFSFQLNIVCLFLNDRWFFPFDKGNK